MKWFEYKQEVDALRASDDLKARLLALQDAPEPERAGTAGAAEAAAGQPAREAAAARPAAHPGKAPLHFSWKKVLPVAAGFALGIVCCGSVLAGRLNLFSMGSAYGTSNFAMAGAADSSAAIYQADTASDGTYSVDKSAAANTLTESADASAGAANGSGSVALSQDDAAQVGQDSGTAAQRMIIYTSSLTLESKAYDDTLQALSDAVSTAGGYISGREEYSSDGSSRSVTLTCRIPADQYKSFLAAAETSGNVTYRSETADDVTADYIDVSAHVDALTAQRDRLLQLESTADTLENLLTIEEQLTNVQYQLDSYESQLKWYQDQVSYCTVTISLSEVKTYTPTETGFLARLGTAFGQALTSFGAALGGILLWLVLRWPWLLLLAAVIVIVVLVRRRRRRT